MPIFHTSHGDGVFRPDERELARALAVALALSAEACSRMMCQFVLPTMPADFPDHEFGGKGTHNVPMPSYTVDVEIAFPTGEPGRPPSCDLSIATQLDDPNALKVQLLLEIKLGTAYRQISIDDADRRLPQPAAYAALWRRSVSHDEADHRVVGAIVLRDKADVDPRWHRDLADFVKSCDPDSPHHTVHAGRELTWREVKSLLLSDIDELPDVATKDEFLRHIDHFEYLLNELSIARDETF